jgi:hypothetical protein
MHVKMTRIESGVTVPKIFLATIVPTLVSKINYSLEFELLGK